MNKDNNLEKRCPWFLSTIFISFVYLITLCLFGIPGIVLQIVKMVKVKPIKKRSIIGVILMSSFSIFVIITMIFSIYEDNKIHSLIDEGKYIEAQQILDSKLKDNDKNWSTYSIYAELYEAQGKDDEAAKKILEFCLVQDDKTEISDTVIDKLNFYGNKSSEETKNQINDFMDKRAIAIETDGKEQNGHNWEEATCEQPKRCSGCGVTEGDALGHNWEEATCEQPKRCSVCGTTEGNPLGHKCNNFVVKKAPSCVEFGIKEGKCKVCKKTFTEQLEKLKHKYGKYKIVEKATCKKEGKEEAVCSICGDKNEKIIEKTRHKYGEYKVVEKATCDKEGREETVCSICGDKKEKVIGKRHHKSNGWEIVREATFDSPGTKSRVCKYCGKELETKKYSLSSGEKEYLYKDRCTWYDYEDVARYPDDYLNDYVAFGGEVLQVIEHDNDIQLRIYVEDDSNKCIYVKYKRKKGESRILERDYITVYGKFKGLLTYETVMGAKVTVPSIDAEYIQIF